MGLDCRAYSKIKYEPDFKRPETDAEWDEFYESDMIHGFAYVGFEQSTRGLVNHDVVSKPWGDDYEVIANGYYSTTPDSESYSWRAGSYGGYSVFRETLAAVSGWEFNYHGNTEEDVNALRDKPFFELVWFADNEGVIGCDAAHDLLLDFLEYRDKYKQDYSSEMYYCEVYDEWITALELAADNGCVVFA